MPARNLNAARNRARQQANINSLDDLGTSLDEFFSESELTSPESVIGNFIKRVHDNLDKEDMIVTGRIADIQIQQTEKGFDVLANEQLIFQDKGVNGTQNKSINDGPGYTNKRPPIEPFIEWIKARNIRAEHNEKYYGDASPFKDVTEDEEIERMAYAMREAQFKNGIKAKNVYSKEIPALIEELGEDFADYTVRTILNSL